MISSLLKRNFKRFGDRYNYDTSYMAFATDAFTGAGFRLVLLPFLNRYRGPQNARAVWAGAMLGSTLEGDCGPCAQLVVDMALEAGAPADLLALCIQGQPENAGDLGLGFRFAQAAIADDPALQDLRAEIESRFGTAALTSISFASATGRVYPVLKRGLGFGKTCQKLTLGEAKVKVQPVR